MRSAPKKRPPPRAPADLAAALKRNAKAAAAFEEFSPSNPREYIEWITEPSKTRHAEAASRRRSSGSARQAAKLEVHESLNLSFGRRRCARAYESCLSCHRGRRDFARSPNSS
jgi:hypothetical protein